MFRKQPAPGSDKAVVREEIDTAKQRLSAVEGRVRILTYQLKVMRRDTSTTTEGKA